MSKLLSTLVAAVFAVTTFGAAAQTPPAKGDAPKAAPAAPAKADAPKGDAPKAEKKASKKKGEGKKKSKGKSKGKKGGDAPKADAPAK